MVLIKGLKKEDAIVEFQRVKYFFNHEIIE